MVSQLSEHLGIPTKHIVEWTQAFVRHPSPQTERFEHEPQVQSFIGERVVPLVQELGLPWRRDPMGNLLVELGPQRADRSLMLMAYAMTHPANRMPNPYAGELIKDASGAHVRGRGVSEQKGSLAAALAAVKAAADRLPLRGRLIFTVSTAGETGRHDAALSICDALGFAPRLAIIVIGTTSRVALANKGRIDAIITVRGKASHSSTPWGECDRGRAPCARSRHGRRCGGEQAPRPRPGDFDTDRRALMAGGDPHRAGRSPAGVRPTPPTGRRSAGRLRGHRGGGRYRRSLAGQDRVRPVHVSRRDRS